MKRITLLLLLACPLLIFASEKNPTLTDWHARIKLLKEGMLSSEVEKILPVYIEPDSDFLGPMRMTVITGGGYSDTFSTHKLDSIWRVGICYSQKDNGLLKPVILFKEGDKVGFGKIFSRQKAEQVYGDNGRKSRVIRRGPRTFIRH